MINNFFLKTLLVGSETNSHGAGAHGHGVCLGLVAFMVKEALSTASVGE